MSKISYVDCTFTVQSGLNTGIQRVVRNLVMRAPQVKKEFDLELCPVVCILGTYYKVSVEDVIAPPSVVASVGKGGKESLFKLRLAAREKFGDGFLLNGFFWAIESILKKGFTVLKFLRLLIQTWKKRSEKVRFQEDSIFIFMDIFWNYDAVSAFRRTKKGNLRVLAIIYDLIPLTHPEFVEEVNRKTFSEALPRLFAVVDHFICISDSVAQDLKAFAKNNAFHRASISHFRLGSDFKAQASESLQSTEVKDLFTKTLPWLVVGTIEPRKNHEFILDAFDASWADGSEEVLVFIGRVGWMCVDLVDRIKHHPMFGKKLFLFTSVSDEELLFCYKHTRGLIFASKVEGFGLPIVEAMRVGVPVFCSDIPVFREVGGDYPTYFSLSQPEQLVEVLKNGSTSRQITSSWPTWDESVREFFKQV